MLIHPLSHSLVSKSHLSHYLSTIDEDTIASEGIKQYVHPKKFKLGAISRRANPFSLLARL